MIPVWNQKINTICISSIPSRSIYHAITFIHARQNHPWYQYGLEGIGSNNKSGKQRFSHLEIHTKYQYLIGMTNLILMNRFFDTHIDTHIDLDYWYHAYTDILVQHWWQPCKLKIKPFGHPFNSISLFPNLFDFKVGIRGPQIIAMRLLHGFTWLLTWVPRILSQIRHLILNTLFGVQSVTPQCSVISYSSGFMHNRKHVITYSSIVQLCLHVDHILTSYGFSKLQYFKIHCCRRGPFVCASNVDHAHFLLFR